MPSRAQLMNVEGGFAQGGEVFGAGIHAVSGAVLVKMSWP